MQFQWCSCSLHYEGKFYKSQILHPYLPRCWSNIACCINICLLKLLNLRPFIHGIFKLLKSRMTLGSMGENIGKRNKMDICVKLMVALAHFFNRDLFRCYIRARVIYGKKASTAQASTAFHKKEKHNTSMCNSSLYKCFTALSTWSAE